MVTMNSGDMPHAEEEELGEVEQMACFLFLLWARQMSNGANYISARGEPSKTFAIYGHHRAAAGASMRYLLRSSHGNCTHAPRSHTLDRTSLGKARVRRGTVNTKPGSRCLQGVQTRWTRTLRLHHKRPN